MVAWLTQSNEQPFTLRIEGIPYDLLTLREGAARSPVVPYVLPESVSLEATADDFGGTLSFTVFQDITPSVTPWWVGIPDNAPVTFSQNRIVDPSAGPQPALFAGFIDNITATLNPGGAGSVAEVTCVGVDAILDRIMVRRFGPKKNGVGAARITIPEGHDAFQIQAVLMYVAGARRFNGELLFDPLNFGRIVQTTTSPLPATEIQVGSLRTALETIMESAQDQDGRRRAFYIDPQTRRLVYSYAEVTPWGYTGGTAPYEITTDPAAENLVSPYTADVYETMRQTGALAAYFTWARSSGIYTSYVNDVYAYLAGSGADPIDTLGPYDASEPSNLGQYFASSPHKIIEGSPAGYALPPGDAMSSVSMWLFPVGNGVHFASGYDAGSGWTGWTIETDTFVPFVPFGPAPLSSRHYFLRVYTAGVKTKERDFFSHTIPVGPTTVDYHNIVVTWWTGAGIPSIRIYVDGIEKYAAGAWVRPAPPSSAYPSWSVGGHPTWTNDALGFHGPLAFFGWYISPEVAAKLYNAAKWAKTANRINARSLELVSDQSRVYKTAMFMTADSTDKDTDADPYIRSVASLKNADGTALAFPQRAGPVFEALVDAPTARSSDAARRILQVDSLARAFFTARHKPQAGARFAVRGAGSEPQQRYGFSAGWAEPIAGTFIYVGAGWRPGQYARIDAPQLGLDGIYRIESVTMGFEPGSFVRTFDIEVDRRPRNRLGRLIVQE